MIAPSELQDVGGLLLQQEWIFAKTMPDNPHWYTLRKKWNSDAAFVRVVQAIRNHGYVERFKGRPYTMLNVNRMKFWTMGAPLEQTILINRKFLGQREGSYDAIAPVYDAAFRDAESEAENQAVMALLGDVTEDHVLDVGCGTGLLLDYLMPRAYTGIDESVQMLYKLCQKHPRWAEDVLHCKLEEFVGGSYDVVACLFGSANYMTPAYIEHLPRLLRPGGRYVVMFYKPGYTPVTYARTGHAVPHFDGIHADLPGEYSELGNFIIVQGTV